MAPHEIDRAVEKFLPLAASLFDEIGRRTTVDGAIRRAPFDSGEQIAADAVAAAACDLGLSVTSDLAGNLHMKWRATQETTELCLVGSHLDSVPRGGNFDGLAGVVAGLTAVAALRDIGLRPSREIVVLGIRGEENAWFACQHIGSRIALGLFDRTLLDRARRTDTGLTLADHIARAGIDLEPIRKGIRSIEPRTVRCFVEVHIEQGQILEERGLAIAIVTAIRGSLRCRTCRCIGAYDHAGTVPRESRRDAIVAVAEVITEMDARWADWDRAGQDLVMTFGQVGTNPAAHSVTVVPGEATFSFEARSRSAEMLKSVEAEIRTVTDRISARRGVSFEFDEFTRSDPVLLDSTLGERMVAVAGTLGIPTMEMVSGGGHDAADFAEAEIRSAMVFVRSSNGSHNPRESMSMADFAEGVRILAGTLAQEATV